MDPTEEDIKLLEDIRSYLDITWDDQAGDKKISGMIDRGKAAINSKGGTEYDYTQENAARGLLFLYVMYERSGQLHEFWTNYKQDIIALQVNQGVKVYAESQQEAI